MSLTYHGGYVNTQPLTPDIIERLPNHKEKTPKEWSSSCPFCGTGDDRFLFWPEDGNYWCRQCDARGFATGSNGFVFIDPEMKAEAERRRIAREVDERKRQMSAIERLQHQRNDIVYHSKLNGQTDYVVKRWGVRPDTIERFKVGYADQCPTYPCDSITIPYYWHGDLINIRHRLLSPVDGGKYRPEMAGLPTAIYNADILASEREIVLVEGEFKTMVLEQEYLPTIGIPGANIFKERWLKHFETVDRVYVTLDPGADEQAARIATMLGRAGVDVRLVTMPVKPDDFFVIYGGDVATFDKYLRMAKRW